MKTRKLAVMAKFNLEIILDQKKIYSHIIFFTFPLILGIGTILFSKSGMTFRDLPGYVALIWIYLEVFILLAGRIFRNKFNDTASRKFLRNLLTGFFIFYVTCFTSALAIIIIFRYLNSLFQGEDLAMVLQRFFNNEFSFWLKATLIGLTIGAIIFLLVQLVMALERERRLTEENLIFQNQTLKNQINPHFLFNSLNNLSSLIISNPKKADLYLSKLSSIYRYVLENIPKDKVPLKSELSFISDYFELYKIRDENKLILSILPENIEDFYILPVSLQILVENAIKHNMATRENPLTISISIADNQVVVENNLQRMSLQLESTKLGLKNLSQRIKLVTGLELSVVETDKHFIVKLPLLT